MRVYPLFLLVVLSMMLLLPIFMQVTNQLFVTPRAILGLPLVLLFVIAFDYLSRGQLTKRDKVMLVVIVLAFLYALLKGLAHNNTQLIGILAYARTFWVFLLFYFLGVALYLNFEWKSTLLILLVYFVISLLFLFYEALGGADAAILLGYHFLQGGTEREWLEGHMKPFFNLKLFKDNLVYRPEGPTGSTITYAYSLLCFPLLFRVRSGSFWLAIIIVFIALLFLGSKGGFILLTLISFSAIYQRLFESDKFLIAILISVAFTVSVVQVLTGDNHGLGLVGGILNLVQNPLGQGLGVGGNLSGEYFNAVDGARSFIYGSESIFGVMFTQIGVFLFILLFLHFSLIKKLSKDPKSRLVKVICTLVVFFGLSQEEAWSTLSAIPFLFLGAYVARNNVDTNRENF